MDESIFIPLGAFLMVVLLVAIPRYFRNKERLEMQQTIRAAIDRGQPLPPELIEAVTRDAPPARAVKAPWDDMRMGAIWLAIGLGLAAFGYAVGWNDREPVAPLLGIACIPIFIGLAFLALGFIGRKERRLDRPDLG